METEQLAKRRPVVFVVPRFHTNLFFATRSLVRAGYPVRVLCVGQSTAEDHSVIEPEIFRKDTGFLELLLYLWRVRPGLILIRDVGSISRKVFWAGLLVGLRMVYYDQKPFRRRRSLRKILVDLFRGRPPRRLTPVLGLDRAAAHDRWASYVPFPVEALPAKAFRRSTENLRVLCVGKLTQARKNHDVVLAAASAVARPQNVVLTFVGASTVSVGGGSAETLDSLRKAVATWPYPGKASILEDIPFRDMPDLYASHDLCVLASTGEPLGTAPLEAMAYGCIPVISDECGSAGYVEQNVDGFVVKTKDVKSLVAVFDELLEDPARRAEVSRRAQFRAATDYGPERFVSAIEELMEAI